MISDPAWELGREEMEAPCGFCLRVVRSYGVCFEAVLRNYESIGVGFWSPLFLANRFK
jgi:hypothetical protein